MIRRRASATTLSSFRLAGLTLVLAISCCFAAIGGASTANAATPGAPPPILDPEVRPDTRISPGCVLTLNVEDEPLLSKQFQVDGNGKITLALTDDDGGNKAEWTVAVAGQTADQARDTIGKSLLKFLKEPVVQVYITRLARLEVQISGAATVNGKVLLPLNGRLSDALAAARYLPNADLENVRIVRGLRTMVVDFAAYERGESVADPPLQMKDKVYIPALPVVEHHDVPTIRVLGEVGRESTLPIAPGMTIKDAIERAGGLIPTSDRDSIRLVRGSDARLLELTASKIEANDPAANVNVGPNDIIIVGRKDRSMSYAVLGEVLRPGTFDWNSKQKMTVMRALERCGGPTKKADIGHIILRRGFMMNPSATRNPIYDVGKVGRGKQADWELEPGDAVVVLAKPKRPNLLMQILPIMLRFIPL